MPQSLTAPGRPCERVTGAGQRGAAVFQHIGVGRDLERHRHVLLNEDAGQPLAIELANGLEQPVDILLKVDRRLALVIEPTGDDKLLKLG
jgi:hypothetical protein